MFKINEQLMYIRPDGVKYRLHAPPSRSVMQEEGFGTPPIDYIVDRAPFQHGDTVRSFTLGPRPVQLVITQNFCSRTEYWAGRAAFLDTIRPNRAVDFNAPGKLLYYLPNNVKRQLDVLLDSGPGFTPDQAGWRKWSFTEAIRFTAHNPVWYDPAARATVFASEASTSDELVFPITFPIEFATFGGSTSVAYEGTWIEYPTLVLTGPIVGPVITNQTTGHSITLDYSIASGETVTIVLYGRKTITNQLGANLLNTISADSDLTEFSLAPDPIAPGGVNVISVGGSGTSGLSTVAITYYNRYFGI